MRFHIYVDLEHVSGPERDEETMLDALCATLGEQNGAGAKAVKVKAGGEWGDQRVSVYKIKLADDRPQITGVIQP